MDADWGPAFGIELPFLKEICEYWRDGFDWKRAIEEFSVFEHYRYKSTEGWIHFVYRKGAGSSPLPIVVTHGWPGSFWEMLAITPRLTELGTHGGDPHDAFDVIVPSLPGFGYSDCPKHWGVNAFRVAEIWCELMTELGYDRFAAQGGDIGASVTTALGLRHKERLIGVHLNFVPGSYKPFVTETSPLTSEEESFLRGAPQWGEEHGAYAHMQRTRPVTAAVALNDSPAGLAAWILEKFRDWSDCRGDVYRRFTRDQLLTNLTIYWMTQTAASSFRMYVEGKRAPLQFGADDFVSVPTAFAHFPAEPFFAPKSWVQRGYNVQRWTEMPRGGHFAAVEEPALLAQDMREFFHSLR